MPPYTLEELKRQDINKAIRESLGESMVKITPISVSLEDVMECDDSEVTLKFVERLESHEKIECITSRGLGPIDALHIGLVDHYSERYPSLKNVKFGDFEAKVAHSKRGKIESSDVVKIKMQFSNGSHRSTTFRSSSNSFFTAATMVLLNSTQFYINCERAFKRLRFLHQEASSRGRHDLVQNYTHLISEIVSVSSYTHLAD